MINIKLGSGIQIAFVRAAELILMPVAILGLVTGSHSQDKIFYLGRLISLGIIVYVAIFMDSYAYGYATINGIRFRRYFRWRTVNWDNISTIYLTPVGQWRFELETGASLRRKLKFGPSTLPLGKIATNTLNDEYAKITNLRKIYMEKT